MKATLEEGGDRSTNPLPKKNPTTPSEKDPRQRGQGPKSLHIWYVLDLKPRDFWFWPGCWPGQGGEGRCEGWRGTKSDGSMVRTFLSLRVQFLLKTDSGYPKDTGVTLFTLVLTTNVEFFFHVLRHKLVKSKNSETKKIAKLRRHLPVKWHIRKQKFDKK